jgi:aerobic C4-dicarboxylate transport protein
MSEARAVTNFSGNAVATVLVGAWTKSVDYTQLNNVLDGKAPFDELTMVDDHGAPASEKSDAEKSDAEKSDAVKLDKAAV